MERTSKIKFSTILENIIVPIRRTSLKNPNYLGIKSIEKVVWGDNRHYSNNWGGIIEVCPNLFVYLCEFPKVALRTDKYFSLFATCS